MKEKYEIPLLHDNHTHVSQYASLIDCLNIQDIEEKSRALELIKERDEEPTIVLGWNSSRYSFDKKQLNKMDSLIICNLSLHGFIMNRPAKKLLKDSYPELVENIEDDDWAERNLPKILRKISEIKSCDLGNIESYFKSLEENGVWSADDMLLINEETFKLIDNSKFSERTDFWADIELYDKLSKPIRSGLKGIKLFTDGALGASTAALKVHYKHNGKGILLHSDEHFKNTLLKIKDKVDNVAIHAIGERAIEQVVRVIEELESDKLPNIRIEHAPFLTEEIGKKALDLDITLCMQPNFSFNSIDFTDRLSAEYLKNNNPFRMIIDEVRYEPGRNLIFGSDGMPHGIDYALKSAIFPPYKKQKLSIHEIKEGYCLDSKKFGFIEVEIERKKDKIKTDVNLKQ
ncbi:MAG: amidohydrolase family protein [Thermoplasmatota archaeon]